METIRAMVRPAVTVGVVGAFVGASVWGLLIGMIDYTAFKDAVGPLAVAAFAFWFGARGNDKAANGGGAPKEPGPAE